MALSYKGYSSSTNTTLTVSAGVVAAGDLMIAFGSSYSANFSAISGTGWTQVADITGPVNSGGNRNYAKVWTKTATSTDAAGTTYTLTGGAAGYMTNHMAFWGGTNPVVDIYTSDSTITTTVGTSPSNATTTAATRRTLFYSTMANAGGSQSTFSSTPSGFAHRTMVYSTAGWQSSLVYTENADFAAGTSTSFSQTLTYNGSNIGIMVAVKEGNQTPVASALTPNNTFLDNRTSSVNLSWTYTDAESNAQNAYELGIWNTESSTMYPSSTSTTFSYTGGVQTYTVPAGITRIRIDAIGAAGGGNSAGTRALGGRAQGDLTVTPGEILNIYVGGTPGNSGNYYLGGYNGGGNGDSAVSPNFGGGGGGATDIRQGGTALANRVIVAGGGGGIGFNGGSSTGGAGGGTSGNAGYAAGGGGTPGAGGTQSTGNALGTGGNWVASGSNYGGGGGGGYYGGYGGTGYSGHGGGGSGYVGTLANSSMTTGYSSATGHGSIIITEMTPYQLYTGTTATSRSFSTGTFTNGVEYQWRVRVSDAVAGFGAWANGSFTSGPNTWSYTPQTTTSSNTASFPDFLPTYGTFENTTDITNGLWQSNPSFGAYTASTVARSNVRANGGTWSLEVTMPTTTGSPATWANCAVTCELGVLYEVSADVWVPTGQSPVEINAVFHETSTQRSTVTNAWQTIKAVVVPSGNPQIFVGVQTTAATTSGQKFYIDNFTVKKLALDGGNYEMQVRTADSGGFGPWSSLTNFVVNSAPTATAVDVNPKSIGGNVTVTWTYADANSDAQSKYQIRHRKEL